MESITGAAVAKKPVPPRLFMGDPKTVNIKIYGSGTVRLMIQPDGEGTSLFRVLSLGHMLQEQLLKCVIRFEPRNRPNDVFLQFFNMAIRTFKFQTSVAKQNNVRLPALLQHSQKHGRGVLAARKGHNVQCRFRISHSFLKMGKRKASAVIADA